MFRKNAFAAISLAVVVSVASFGCALNKRIAEDLPATFLEDVDRSSKKENLPFEHAWVRSGARKSNYDSVFFKPVRVDRLPQGEWSKSASALIVSQEDYMAKAQEIARYFHEQLVEKTSKEATGARRLTVASRPGPKTLVIEIALTELEFSHPVARAGSLAVPVPGTGAALSTVSDPHVAFAARLTDGATGQLLATVADRKFAPMRIVDLNKMTVSSSNREICALWADVIAKGLQSDPSTKISEKQFALLPW